MTEAKPPARPQIAPVHPDALRWRCDPVLIEGASTDEIEPIEGVVGQDDAMEALRFGLEVDAPGQNVFVRGLAGTGRLTLVRDMLRRIEPNLPLAPDRVYVHDFHRPDCPRLLTLPRGEGEPFRRAMEDFAQFVVEDLAAALHSDELHAQRADLEEEWQRELTGITSPLEQELAEQGLAMAVAQQGDAQRPIILPILEGEPVPPDELQAMVANGKVDPEQMEALADKIGTFRPKLERTHARVGEARRRHRVRMRELVEEAARQVLSEATGHIAAAFPPAEGWLEDVVDDVSTRRLGDLDEEDHDFLALYEVNLILSSGDGQQGDEDHGRPVIIENSPTMQGLLGTMEVFMGADGLPRASHMSLHAGSLLRADGGFLIMEARDVLTEPGAWRALIRTLRSGSIELAPPEGPTTLRVPGLKPQPIEVRVKVVLLGDGPVYGLLDQLDPDFPLLFKVLADFDTVIPRQPEGLRFYGGVLSRLVREEALPRLEASAIAALLEHGARVAAQAGMVTARFGRVADIAREAAYLARHQGADSVGAEHVREAVARTKRRADLPGRHFRSRVAAGVIRIQTQGVAVGQVNGLAVMQAGPLTYGFPTRITATIGAGTGGAVDVEREAELSGAIHTKAFYILKGLLRTLLRTDHPLTFDASIAFEQSYGGIDGDSASGVELCCLMSALTGVPVRQDLAMTGAVDQMGNLLPIGAVNEKIEGFYDTCCTTGLTGTQGVLVPRANVHDLMLRPDVVEACSDGRFHVYALDRIEEALGLLTGRDPGTQGEDGRWPEGSLLALAVEKARLYWQMVQQHPVAPG